MGAASKNSQRSIKKNKLLPENALKAAFVRAKKHPLAKVNQHGRPALTLETLAIKLGEMTGSSVSKATLDGKPSSWFVSYPFKYHRKGSQGRRELHREKIRNTVFAMASFVKFGWKGRSEFILQFIREARQETGDDVWFDVTDKFYLRSRPVDPLGPMSTVVARSEFPTEVSDELTFETLFMTWADVSANGKHELDPAIGSLLLKLGIGDGGLTKEMREVLVRHQFERKLQDPLIQRSWNTWERWGAPRHYLMRLGIDAGICASDSAKLLSNTMNSYFSSSFVSAYISNAPAGFTSITDKIHRVLDQGNEQEALVLLPDLLNALKPVGIYFDKRQSFGGRLKFLNKDYPFPTPAEAEERQALTAAFEKKMEAERLRQKAESIRYLIRLILGLNVEGEPPNPHEL